MKTVELGYLSSGGTHFLYTPNIFDIPAQNVTDNKGKEVCFVAFAKSWDACLDQAKDQLNDITGGNWVHLTGDQFNSNPEYQTVPDVLGNKPKMALSLMTA